MEFLTSSQEVCVWQQICLIMKDWDFHDNVFPTRFCLGQQTPHGKHALSLLSGGGIPSVDKKNISARVNTTETSWTCECLFCSSIKCFFPQIVTDYQFTRPGDTSLCHRSRRWLPLLSLPARRSIGARGVWSPLLPKWKPQPASM